METFKEFISESESKRMKALKKVESEVYPGLKKFCSRVEKPFYDKADHGEIVTFMFITNKEKKADIEKFIKEVEKKFGIELDRDFVNQDSVIKGCIICS